MICTLFVSPELFIRYCAAADDLNSAHFYITITYLEALMVSFEILMYHIAHCIPNRFALESLLIMQELINSKFSYYAGILLYNFRFYMMPA